MDLRSAMVDRVHPLSNPLQGACEQDQILLYEIARYDLYMIKRELEAILRQTALQNCRPILLIHAAHEATNLLHAGQTLPEQEVSEKASPP